jgi:hypothetical protein
MNSVTLSDLVSNFIIHEWFIIWSNCNSLGRYIFFNSIYRPPNSNLHIWELLCESVDKALDSDLPLFLVGDYNCDMLSNSSNYFRIKN